MVQANYTVVGSNKKLSEAQASVHNNPNVFTTQNYMLNRKPDGYVYLYNVSEQEHKVSRPPTIKEMTIPSTRSAGNMDENGNPKAWILATKFPNPLIAPKASVDSDEVDFYATDTKRFVMDIVNPENLGLDQDAVLDPKYIYSKGNDLGLKGVFWSENFPPTDDEVERAINRLEKGYRILLEEARTVEVSRPAELSAMLTPGHHAACEYFQETTSWHGKKVRQENCENCGERVKVGSAFHKTDEGGMCIRNWARAIKAGVRTKAQAFEATELPEFAPQQTPPQPTPAPVSQV